jgi:tetratricopeptide (TPR) repeat protein
MSLNYVALKNLHAQVLAWLEQGIPQKAKRKLDELTFEEKDNLFVEYLQGICEQELGNRERAIRRFKYVISQDPGFVRAAEALYHLAEDSLTTGEKKYLCQIIHFHKPDDAKAAEFLKEHTDTPTELILKALQSSGEVQLIDDDTFAAAETTIESEATPLLELTEESPQEQTEPEIIDEIDSPLLETAEEETAEAEFAAAESAVESQPEPEEIPTETKESEEPELLQELDLAPDAELTDENPEPEAAIITESQPEPEQAAEDTLSEAKAPEPATEESPAEAYMTAEPESKSPHQKTKTRRKIANYETLTMAQVYKEQGLFEQALAILEKLAENAIDPDRIQLEISKIKKLMEEKENQ